MHDDALYVYALSVLSGVFGDLVCFSFGENRLATLGYASTPGLLIWLY